MKIGIILVIVGVIAAAAIAYTQRCKNETLAKFLCKAGAAPSQAVADIRELGAVDPTETDPKKAVTDYLEGRAKPVRSGPT